MDEEPTERDEGRRWPLVALAVVAAVALVTLVLAVRGDDGAARLVAAQGGEAEAPPIPVDPAPDGAPVLVAVAGDAEAGTVTLTFDRPVRPGPEPYAAMFLHVHGGEASCPGGHGNGQQFLDGAGTATVTIAAAALVPGTSYVSIVPGLVVEATTGVANAAVGCTAVATGAARPPQVATVTADGGPGADGSTVDLTFDRLVWPADAAAVSVYADSACLDHIGDGTGFVDLAAMNPFPGQAPPPTDRVRVAVPGIAPGLVYVTVRPGLATDAHAGQPNLPVACREVRATSPPVFLSATGVPGRLTIRFDQPVIGEGGDLTAMRLLVFGRDAGCGAPQGNGHVYVAGSGTDTITVEATSIEVGTTFIAIVEGFVTSAADGTPNRMVRCVAVPVSG